MARFAPPARPREQGFQLVLVLVYAAVFTTLLVALVGYVVVQNKSVRQDVALAEAIQVAEAGLQYYKWYLAHNPGDLTHGTTTPGPYVQSYEDPEGDTIGSYELDISGKTFCGQTDAITIRSTGRTLSDPAISRTVSARVARPSVANFSFITNAGVWYGSGGTINGPVHSNQGIRMEAANNSTVTSGVSDWNCTSSYGCSPSQIVDGVYSSGSDSNPGLFAFPSAPINFAGLTVDMNFIKDLTVAPASTGHYFGPTGSGIDGYELVFNSDQTVTVYEVDDTWSYWAWNSTDGWEPEYNVIDDRSLVGTYSITDECPVIFVEDKTWISGTVSNKVTVASADLQTPGQERSMVLNGNITYTSATSSGITALAQKNVHIGLVVPNDLNLNGIFIAQNGKFTRNYYTDSGWYRLPFALRPYILRDSLTRYGTVVSNSRAGINWLSGGTTVSGFLNGNSSYDRNLANNPPPFTPRTSDVYELFEWQEERE
jgi:hypothetical protein